MMTKANNGAKALLVLLAFVACGWAVHLVQYGGDARPGIEDPRSVIVPKRGGFATGADDESRKEVRKQIDENWKSIQQASKWDTEDRSRSERWGEARPRNPEACKALTMDAPPWKMKMLGCLLAGEYPPAILERGELVRLDDALREANRAPTVAGYVADYPRDVEFCSEATTMTPRLDTWLHGCLPWGADPHINRHPVVLLDDALKQVGLEPTKPGPLAEKEPRNDDYCGRARNTDNPLQLWRNGCLRRGEFPPFVDPEMRLDDAMREAAQAKSA